ncbi:MAG: hypothetical protein KDD55_04840 [Bdellovibrionales bacterium]|nr:hypothetical protein [Bdellovibrionales bacterium]
MDSNISKLAGFLKQDGSIRSKEELKKADQALAQPESASPPSASTQASEQDFSVRVAKGFQSLRSRFLEQANDAISVVNERIDDTKTASKLVKQTIGVAKELKSLMKDGATTEEIDKKKAELDKLLAAGREQEQTIKEHNRPQQDDPNVSFLSVGNNVRGLPKIDRVKFSASQKTGDDLQSVKDVNSLLQELKGERSSLVEQRRSFRDDKKEIKNTLQVARKDLNEAKESLLRDASEAEKLSQKIAADIKEAAASGSQEFLANNLDESIVNRLVAA